ncbi:ABC transporter substrate-binding protein [Steroidobacter agaridevorans]|uniref:ABC transporter substrate-binding protein n=1 Tax=Steroidobacter agaridevorans TaxID=2695856 RepID=A0A829Y8E4_9GAMM|nr:TRAP transporter substrate-binding protein [Steroidobacter agaridevorans]GFE79450.1 ABC transporter substrate-binding protein [Steroidobacter agaridevorans]
MKRVTAVLLFVIVLLSAATPLHAQTVLRLSNWLPSQHPLFEQTIKPWTEQVTKATDGRVVIQLLAAPLGPPAAHFDFAANGVADVTFGIHSYTPGRFTATLLAELPFQTESAEYLSVAYWRVHQRYLAKANEHRGTKLLAIFTHGPGQLWTRDRDLSSMQSLRGSKIRVAGGFAQDGAKALGVIPIQAPVTEVYQVLAGGIADGVEFPAESIDSFNLTGVLDRGLLVPGGLYNVSMFLVVNAGRWSKLSKQDQDAIMSVSGEQLARTAGRTWDRADADALASMRKAGKIELATPSEQQMAAIRKALEPYVTKTLQQISAKGIDARAAQQELQKEIAALKARGGS